MNKKGFTILETILAIFILTTATFSSFALIQQTIVAASLNQSKLVAYYYAQEGIENIKNIRDENLVKNVEWNYGISPPFSETASFNNFTRQTTISQEYDSSLDVYFLEVNSIVTWNDRGRNYNISVISNLYEWN